jgi:hypothetical protein
MPENEKNAELNPAYPSRNLADGGRFGAIRQTRPEDRKICSLLKDKFTFAICSAKLKRQLNEKGISHFAS